MSCFRVLTTLKILHLLNHPYQLRVSFNECLTVVKDTDEPIEEIETAPTTGEALTGTGAPEAPTTTIARDAAKVMGGGGGGRPEMAQAGGKIPDKVGEALQGVPDLVRQGLT